MNHDLHLALPASWLVCAAICGAVACRCPDRTPVDSTVTARKDPPDAGAAPSPSGSCIALGAGAPSAVGPIRVAGTALQARGPALLPTDPRATTSPGKPVLRLGVVADTREATPATLQAVDRARKAFAQAKVDAVIVLGGIDASFEGATAILRELGTAVPLLAMPGDRISRDGFQAAVRELGAGAVDLTLVHRVELPTLTLIAVPGYFLRHHVIAGAQGCTYGPPDLARLSMAVQRSAKPRVLLSHGPPRGRGPNAVDRGFGAENLGDPALSRLLQQSQIDFGLFAHIGESGGQATTRQGRPVPQGRWSDSLLLNVGTADAVPHQRVDGRWGGPEAAVFELVGHRARFRMIDLGPTLTPEAP